MLTQTLERLAKACRILEKEGHGDLSLGHVSVRDPQGRGFWLKRNRAGLGEIRGPQDFVLVSFSGEKLAGEGGCHSEWPIHAEILTRRADVHVVAHTHALHASLFSGSGEALLPYTLDADYFAELPRHADEVALITTPEEGAALARSLGPHFAVLMANHGVTFCGTSVEHATCVGVFLEKACRAHLLARAAGLQARPLAPAVRAKRHAQIMTPAHIEHSWDYLCRVWT
ncbi:MAG TPA: class II aldolase/adducin family protein [Burkholderiales bacterium]|nr:class II aldolase/adducin family protein [Burkholderiales bacterium]